MRPTLPKSKISKRLITIYISIFVICTIGIGIALYLQYFKEEKIEIVFGITDSEGQDEYNELKSQFNNIFENKIEKNQSDELNIEKINNDYDIVVTAHKYQENEGNQTIEAYIPYLNLKNENAREINTEINERFGNKAKSYLDRISNIDIIYKVEYEAYVQNNILSLVIRSELREGSNSQKVEIQTYNYHLVENRLVTLEEILKLKNIDVSIANSKIKSEIQAIQEQNQPLIEQGYPFYQRDYTLEMYNVEYVKQYFLGKDGMLYVVFPYGNEDGQNTNETDIVIFK